MSIFFWARTCGSSLPEKFQSVVFNSSSQFTKYIKDKEMLRAHLCFSLVFSPALLIFLLVVVIIAGNIKLPCHYILYFSLLLFFIWKPNMLAKLFSLSLYYHPHDSYSFLTILSLAVDAVIKVSRSFHRYHYR